jgi:hypothetical protein
MPATRYAQYQNFPQQPKSANKAEQKPRRRDQQPRERTRRPQVVSLSKNGLGCWWIAIVAAIIIVLWAIFYAVGQHRGMRGGGGSYSWESGYSDVSPMSTLGSIAGGGAPAGTSGVSPMSTLSCVSDLSSLSSFSTSS